MVLFAPAKINIGLNILQKRPDGFHDLDTFFLPIGWHDLLEFVEWPQAPAGQELDFRATGLPIDGPPEQNLCVRAVRLLARERPLPPLRLRLQKLVPMGAGLGGGSSDAASLLVGLDRHFGLGLGTPRLEELAGQLGSDCPFFVQARPALGRGKGDQLEPFSPDLRGLWLAVAHPGIGVPTAKAYASVRPRRPATPLRELLGLPVGQWQGRVANDFEDSVLPAYPAIAGLKRALLEAGAVYAAMSGSGSAVFGLFEQRPEALRLRLDVPHLWVQEL